jgi:hypothetical protein
MGFVFIEGNVKKWGFLAVPCEEDGARSRSVAYTNNIALK